MKKLEEYRDAWLLEEEELVALLVNGDWFDFVMSHEDNVLERHQKEEIVQVTPTVKTPVFRAGLWRVGSFTMMVEYAKCRVFDATLYDETVSRVQYVYITDEMMERVTKKGGSK